MSKRHWSWSVLAALVVTGSLWADDLAAPWKSQDIGDCGTKGSASVKDGKYTLKASGGDIWDAADAFHFMYQPLKGDGWVVAKVTSLENTNEWAKCGVMIRGKLEADAPHAMCVTTPGNSCHIQWRAAKGQQSGFADNAVGEAAPYWVKIVRVEDTFTGYVSKDGQEWKKAGETTVSMGEEVFAGVCLTAHDNGAVTTALVESVEVKAEKGKGGPALPEPWKCKVLGAVGVPGSVAVKDGKWTLKVSGADIWDAADGLRFLYQPIKGDGTIIAKVTSLENTNEWAKCGVMFRETLTPGSRHVMCVTTPGQNCHIQWRATADQESGYGENPVGQAAPYWVKLVRAGNKFTASVSKDGKEWTAAGETTNDMAKEAFVGIALTSHDDGTATTAVVEEIKVEPAEKK